MVEASTRPVPSDGGNRNDAGDASLEDAGVDAASDASQDLDADGPQDGDDAGLDPNIVFDWVETLPGQGTCSPARYVGSFTCTVEQATGPALVGGQIRFELAGSAEGELLIENGVVSDLTGLIFSGALEGSLDCVTDTLAAMTDGGTALILLSPFRKFEARLDGDFDEESLEIHGDFVMTNDAGQVCRGMFQAVVAP